MISRCSLCDTLICFRAQWEILTQMATSERIVKRDHFFFDLKAMTLRCWCEPPKVRVHVLMTHGARLCESAFRFKHHCASCGLQGCFSAAAGLVLVRSYMFSWMLKIVVLGFVKITFGRRNSRGGAYHRTCFCVPQSSECVLVKVTEVCCQRGRPLN